MGGTCFRDSNNIVGKRITLNEMKVLYQEINYLLFNIIYSEVSQTKYNNAIEEVMGMPVPMVKDDYGDIDIIYFTTDVTSLTKRLREIADKPELVKRHADCISIIYKGVQVDFILASSIETFNWKLNWYSFGDTSAIIGHFARCYNLKFSDTGLKYSVKRKYYKRGRDDILVTNDFKIALEILGFEKDFNYLCPSNGFNKIDNVYKWIITSDKLNAGFFFRKKPSRRTIRPMQGNFRIYLADYFNKNPAKSVLTPTQKYAYSNTLQYLSDLGYWDIREKVKKVIKPYCFKCFWKDTLYDLINPIRRKINKFRYTILNKRINDKKR